MLASFIVIHSCEFRMGDYMNKFKHWLFILAHVVTLVLSSMILCPLYFVKLVGLWNTSRLIDYHIFTVQYTSHLLVLWLLGIKVYLYKERNLPDGFRYGDTILLTANHLSELDPMFIGIMYQHFFRSKSHITSFAKHTLRFYPFINSLLLANDTIFVENKNKQQNKGQHVYIADKLKTDVYPKRTILIFPEGTTYSEKVKNYREDNAKKNGTPTFEQLLVPKTNGLHLIRKHSNVKEEYNVVMKFINRKNGDDPNLGGLLKGESPKEVHVLMTRQKEFDSGTLDIENRHLFDNYVYDTFRQMDANLQMKLGDWESIYQKTEVKPSWETICWSLIYAFLSFITFWCVFTNGYMMIYSGLSILFFYIAALLEFR